MPHRVFMHGVAPAAGMVVGRADAAVGQLIVRGQVQDLLPGGGGFVIAAIELQRAGLVQQLREAGRAQNVDGCAGDVQDIELAAAVHVDFAGKLVLAAPDAAAAKYEQEVAVLVILIDPACTLVDGGDCAVVVNCDRHKARRLLPGAPALTENFVFVELLLEALVDEDIGANGAELLDLARCGAADGRIDEAISAQEHVGVGGGIGQEHLLGLLVGVEEADEEPPEAEGGAGCAKEAAELVLPVHDDHTGAGAFEVVDVAALIYQDLVGGGGLDFSQQIALRGAILLQQLSSGVDLHDTPVAGIGDPERVIAAVAVEALRGAQIQLPPELADDLSAVIELDDTVVAGVDDIEVVVAAIDQDVARRFQVADSQGDAVDDMVQLVGIRQGDGATCAVDRVAVVRLEQALRPDG